MERIELLSGFVTVRQPQDTEGVGYELIFDVEKGSPSDAELEHYFNAGELFPLPYQDESLAVSLRSVEDQDDKRIYHGAAGFLRPGMGGAGG